MSTAVTLLCFGDVASMFSSQVTTLVFAKSVVSQLSRDFCAVPKRIKSWSARGIDYYCHLAMMQELGSRFKGSAVHFPPSNTGNLQIARSFYISYRITPKVTIWRFLQQRGTKLCIFSWDDCLFRRVPKLVPKKKRTGAELSPWDLPPRDHRVLGLWVSLEPTVKLLSFTFLGAPKWCTEACLHRHA